MSPTPPSTFLSPGPVTTTDSLAILHLRRDLLLPTTLSHHDPLNEGYSEGRVTNTRFGSFPHSTLIGLPWGSQVRASRVDTGSRGRKGPTNPNLDPQPGGKKRKREAAGLNSPPAEGHADDAVEDEATAVKEAVAAESGFVHVLPPTPESWTVAIPHRTQVVYTPDYSYILHRLRVRPGSVVVEAGAGSGSFTHAAARAVFNGYDGRKRKRGRVLSYEFHEQRAEKLVTEIREHGLEEVVKLTYRDVCRQGFNLSQEDMDDGEVPLVDAVFLDLPAPWLALPHLTRSPSTKRSARAVNGNGLNGRSPSVDTPVEPSPDSEESPKAPLRSPLNPSSTVRICTFSPCIEQVQRTITTLRQLGWLDIEMVEIAQKRVEVRRERVGLQEEGVKGANVTAASVDEAVARLRDIEGRFRTFHDETKKVQAAVKADDEAVGSDGMATPDDQSTPLESKQAERAAAEQSLLDDKAFKKGRLIHRTEPELKSHTSYLVFALLPEEWTAEDEEAARLAWPVEGKAIEKASNDSHRARKRADRAAREAAAAAKTAAANKPVDEVDASADVGAPSTDVAVPSSESLDSKIQDM